jgi:hypothetical protein
MKRFLFMKVSISGQFSSSSGEGGVKGLAVADAKQQVLVPSFIAIRPSWALGCDDRNDSTSYLRVTIEDGDSV